jgi:ribonucleotide monophosphatase NagD (HAD superfamily)
MPMSYVCDMDGMIYHGSRLIPGALEFVRRLQSRGHKFLFLTNNSQWTPRDLKHKLEQMGISVDEAAFHTSALAEKPYFVGKPNPLMMWTALGTLRRVRPKRSWSATVWAPTSLPVPRPA